MHRVPLVSVVIPTYNAEATVRRAIESVLLQCYPNIEIVVVDDNSSDSTLAVLEEFGDKIIILRHEVNRNGAAARNNGVRASNGEYIAFLDSDDWFLPDKLSKQMLQYKYLQSEMGNMICLACAELGKANSYSDICNEIAVSSIFKKEYTFNTSSILISREFFDKVNGFDEAFLRHQDLELFVRLAKSGHLYFYDQPLLLREFSGSPSFASTQSGIVRFWDKFIDDIESMSNQDRRYIYALGYRRLAELAFKEKKGICFLSNLIKAFIKSPNIVVDKIPYYFFRAMKRS